MNKLLRQKLKRKYYLRRIKLLASWNTKSWTELDNEKWTMCWKTTGKPCSCVMCSPYKYDRSEQKRLNRNEILMSDESKTTQKD